MAGATPTASQVYRVGAHLLGVVRFFTVAFTALGIFVVVKKGDWTLLAVTGVVALLFVLLLQLLRLEISSTGFRYRNLSGSREMAFADVGRAYFEVVRGTNSPQGVAAFWVEGRDGKRVKVNLRTFSVQAAAALFTALESNGIQIEVPDEWAAKRVVDQVRAVQAKQRG
jgi:hypothetical protein